MLNLDSNSAIHRVELTCRPDAAEGEEAVVVIALVVPVAAKVTASRRQLEVALLLVQPQSITTTVPGKMVIQLRANNTALAAAWWSTATLPEPAAQRRSFRQ